MAATKSYRKRKHILYYGDGLLKPSPKRAQIIHNNPLLPYLPQDIIIDILAKLPTKSILNCKQVCKEWRDIINTPSFAQVHYRHSHIALIGFRFRLQTKSMLILEKVNQNTFESMKINNNNNKGFGLELNIVNSCRGFLLINGGALFHIYNPFTKECISTRWPCYDNLLVSGLGYSGTTKKYKVVSFYRHQHDSSFYLKQTLTIRTGSSSSGSTGWTQIIISEGSESIILDKIRPENNNTLALNDSIHWLATGEKIARYELDKEELSFVDSPRLGDAAKCVISIGVLHGCLCVNVRDVGNSRYGIESWVMKEYGKVDSWVRVCVVKDIVELVKFTPELAKYKILDCGEDDQGKVIVVTPNGTVFCYDIRLQRSLKMDGFHAIKGMQLHFLGFFRILQDWPDG